MTTSLEEFCSKPRPGTNVQPCTPEPLISVFRAPVSNTTDFVNMTWSDLAAKLTAEPAFLKDNSTQEKASHGAYYVRGKINGKRQDNNLIQCSLVVLDIDKPVDGLPLPTPEEIHSALSDAQHATHSTATPGRSRIVFPVAPYNKEDAGRMTQAAYAFCRSRGLNFALSGESKTKSQAFFLSQTTDIEDHQAYANTQGPFFTPDMAPEWQEATIPPTPDRKNEYQNTEKTEWRESTAPEKSNHNRLAAFIDELSTGTIHETAKQYVGWLSRTTNLTPRQIFDDVTVLINKHCPDKTKVERWLEGERDQLEKWFTTGNFNAASMPPVAEQDAGWFSRALAVSSVARFVDHPPPVLDWIFEGSLLAKTVGAFVGPGGSGKSTFMLEMMFTIATGRDILPGIFKSTCPGKVLAIFAEEDETILHHRFNDLKTGFFPHDPEAVLMLKENMHTIAAAGHDLRLLAKSPNGESATNFFHNVLAAAKDIQDLRLIVIDPLSRFFGAEENDNGAGTFFISLLEQLAQATGAAVIVCHHVGKRAATSSGKFELEAAMHQDAARGASAITNGVRWQCNLVVIPEKVTLAHVKVKSSRPGQFLALQVSKKNYGKPEPVHFLERQQGGVLVPYVVAEKDNAPGLEEIVRDVLLNEISQAENEGKKLTKKMILDGCVSEWKKRHPSITRTAVDRTITGCLMRGDLHERPGKNGSGKAISYLSLEPEIEPGEPEIEPEALEPEEPEETGKTDLPLLNLPNLRCFENRKNRTGEIMVSGS